MPNLAERLSFYNFWKWQYTRRNSSYIQIAKQTKTAIENATNLISENLDAPKSLWFKWIPTVHQSLWLDSFLEVYENNKTEILDELKRNSKELEILFLPKHLHDECLSGFGYDHDALESYGDLTSIDILNAVTQGVINELANKRLRHKTQIDKKTIRKFIAPSYRRDFQPVEIISYSPIKTIIEIDNYSPPKAIKSSIDYILSWIEHNRLIKKTRLFNGLETARKVAEKCDSDLLEIGYKTSGFLLSASFHQEYTPRAIGLWLFDHINEQGSDYSLNQAITDFYETDFAIKLVRKLSSEEKMENADAKDYYRWYNWTTACIKAHEVLPFSSNTSK